jgi:hypothetical protein
VLGALLHLQIANADLEAASGSDFGALNDTEPLTKTEVGREVGGVGMLLFRSRTPWT